MYFVPAAVVIWAPTLSTFGRTRFAHETAALTRLPASPPSMQRGGGVSATPLDPTALAATSRSEAALVGSRVDPLHAA